MPRRLDSGLVDLLNHKLRRTIFLRTCLSFCGKGQRWRPKWQSKTEIQTTISTHDILTTFSTTPTPSLTVFCEHLVRNASSNLPSLHIGLQATFRKLSILLPPKEHRRRQSLNPENIEEKRQLPWKSPASYSNNRRWHIKTTVPSQNEDKALKKYYQAPLCLVIWRSWCRWLYSFSIL